MHISQLLDVHSDVVRYTFRRMENRIAQKREPYFAETGTVLRRNGNSIAKKREPYCEEILSKETRDVKGAQIKTTGYNVCAERNLQKGHTLIISSALPWNGAESAKFNRTKAGNTGKRQPGFRRIQEIC